jgi:hypothetical protein
MHVRFQGMLPRLERKERDATRSRRLSWSGDGAGFHTSHKLCASDNSTLPHNAHFKTGLVFIQEKPSAGCKAVSDFCRSKERNL